MPPLATSLRKQLEKAVADARDEAEEGARAALLRLGVDRSEPFDHLSAAERELRTKLRARGRQTGDALRSNKTQEIDQLAQELAYEYWHRMLFARFLAENDLLLHPDGVAVSLRDCEDLAAEEKTDHWTLASRYAARMLPQIFRPDDPLLQIPFAPEHKHALERLLAGLSSDVFTADDSLGWVYQFWQKKRKDEVNASGEKIDGRTLSAVTQLFTEHYMVEFLLHNTIGAWWCARHGIKGPPGGSGVPAGQCPVEMAYLRWRDDGTPAAGTFDGWPTTLREFTLLDPCCGSGHFLVAALQLLLPLRMHDEGLSLREACDSVLSKNLFGLEIDQRCTQIAAFALALAAWKLASFHELPPLNIACSGVGPQASEAEWLKLAEQSDRPLTALSREPVLNGLRNLHSLFSNAPTLGSLINPNQLSADLISADYETLQPYLVAALTAEHTDDDTHERAVATAGMVKAAEMLARDYTLVATNVPYLGRPDQAEILKEYCDDNHREARSDLATCFLERCATACQQGGTSAVVTPQSWLFQPGYKKFRTHLLKSLHWEFLARLGPRAFETIGGERVNVCLVGISCSATLPQHSFFGVDVQESPNAAEKSSALLTNNVTLASQADQLKNPDTRITLDRVETGQLLVTHAACIQGLATSDDPQFTLCFWELNCLSNGWEGLMGTVESTRPYGGRERVLHWEDGKGRYYRHAQALKAEGRLGGWKSGTEARGKTGVLVSQMSAMPVTLYTGEFYDHSASVIIADDESKLPAVWAFASSEVFAKEVRKLDQSLKPSNSVFVKVPFDLDYWGRVSSDEFKDGLPKPQSDDPTQWLFNGHPKNSENPLQVAVARLLGYRWPLQTGFRWRDCPAVEADGLHASADEDGIVCLAPTRGERSAADRLRELLATAFGCHWSAAKERELIDSAGCIGWTLDDWLRDGFFEQHCQLFHQRPFIWHVWDGRRKDGFHALVNYHKLDAKLLDSLIYSYLGDWVRRQEAEAKAGKSGADGRLADALKLQNELKKIATGEPPYDIFVRWKLLAEQPSGWEPDLNDGVRINIRPFMTADILRKRPKIHWKKDKGKDVESAPWFKVFQGDRINDHHLTLAEKRVARERG